MGPTPTPRLEAERATAKARVLALASELEAIVLASRDANGDDEHDAEGPTVAFERQRLAGLLGHAQSVLAELDGALSRLARGGYGRCGACGSPIDPERLVALPATTRCIACARHRERDSRADALAGDGPRRTPKRP